MFEAQAKGHWLIACGPQFRVLPKAKTCKLLGRICKLLIIRSGRGEEGDEQCSFTYKLGLHLVLAELQDTLLLCCTSNTIVCPYMYLRGSRWTCLFQVF